MLSYLSKIPDVEEVEGLEQLTLLHAEDLAARCQESPDILQAQELCGEDRKGSTVSDAPSKCTGTATCTSDTMSYHLPFRASIFLFLFSVTG